MTHTSGGPRSQAGPPSSAAPLAEAPLPVPARADGVQLIGKSEGSGYREPPALVRRADGQTLQLTPLLYEVLEAVDGRRSEEEIAAHAGAASGRLISADNVRTLMDSQLLPLGLLRLADGSQPEVRKADPLLGMRFRYTVTDPERTRRITAPFTVLFNPLIVVAVTAAFLASCWWVLMVKGLASATHEAFDKPVLLLLIFAVTILSAGFHEFGHAAAARKGGSAPGAMGAGLYLVWPAFFTDVTDSYRLGRAGRLRTDFGGLYFNAIVAVAIMGLWWATGFDALLLVVVTQILQMVRQLLPLVRFDGYHILADAAGVPDLFQRIKPTLLGLLPWHWGNPESRVLKPWARAVVTLWVLVTVPLLLFSLAMMVISLPRLLATAWSSAAKQQALLAESLSDGDLAGAAVRVLAIAAVALPMVGVLYILLRLLRQLVTGLWQKTRGKFLQRAAAMGAVAALLAGLAWAWWPDGGTYRPVQPYERGTLADATTSILPSTGTALREGGSGRTVALWPEGTATPTRENPQLAMVLVPLDDSAADSSTGSPAGSGSPAAPSWVFPFDRPAAPEEDGNQALAVNTADGSVTYSVAFALVWAEDGEPVDTRNEAYAFANCTGCAAVAVGFQVVLVVGQTDVIVPENLSAAANYNCLDCLTYALASQLVLTLDGPPGEASLAQLNALWAEIAEYGRNIQNVPLSEIQGRLAAYKEQITAIIQADPGATKGQAAGSTASPTTPAVPGSSPSGNTAPGSGTGGEAPAPAGTAPANAPATQPAPGDAPPSYAPVETVAPTADTGGTAPAVEPVPTANPS
ncbi:tat (twin-arginine translocation) pathway signal sequence domain protein [Pseudarthrobacter siccitolerans]|uniref:Tat (Twin-arginine translocation) pathway signal sequence domain protein n=1 Tax=Pseudarthrobacter siccitolerans TaxID=861266 RepID=A0A024GYT0_9MICC|nr:M50 family metallopeptidase [Pseudarthrobacter siccitolerans]CCQ44913.1 tat (twin-arginine translocation) pathway signal sequence domain protein [Pseudarthrobacter siccitolerans]